ncbi:MAG: GTP cyclohydrolase-2 [Alphaproteobacteria bacterium MarineAlpha11_Bin1]|nr:MAG: GTP cyclohydrolase-2 [Alphaproteobacteria bacterium MarineAlpha11_Bin1]|tara:strand:+ start:4800 stop:5930 length:1131 start_codon:yes stop_codon:yes gene_type:complete
MTNELNSDVSLKESLSPLASVERAAFELRSGRPVFVVDDTDSAALVLATEMLTQERANALIENYGDTLPHIVLTHERAETLKIRLYTPNVVRIPYPHWLSTDQVRQLADPQFDLLTPMRGPFIAKRDKVSDAVVSSVKLAKVGRILPSVLEVSLPAVSVAKYPEIITVSSSSISSYDILAASKLRRVTAADVPLVGAENSKIIAFRPEDGGIEHLAIVIGDPSPSAPVLIRLHSECFTGDLLGSLKCDCGDQLRGAIEQIGKEGSGILLYLAQEGRGIGLINKLRAYALQDQGFDTVEANQRLGFADDERVFLAAAEILGQLGFSKVRLLTNNPRKVKQLEEYGICVSERVEHKFESNEHNERYLAVKAEKSGHLF